LPLELLRFVAAENPICHSGEDHNSIRRMFATDLFEVVGMTDLTVQAKIRAEIYRAFEALGADRKLLATVGSWGDTSMMTKCWNFLENGTTAPCGRTTRLNGR
jgi:hypothetical protein